MQGLNPEPSCCECDSANHSMTMLSQSQYDGTHICIYIPWHGEPVYQRNEHSSSVVVLMMLVVKRDINHIALNHSTVVQFGCDLVTTKLQHIIVIHIKLNLVTPHAPCRLLKDY